MNARDSTSTSLPLAGDPDRTGRWLFALAFVLPLAAIAVALVLAAADKPLPGPVLVAPAIAVALCAVGWLWLRRTIGRVGVRLGASMLQIDCGIVRRDFPLAALARNGLDVVDLEARTELKPALRTWGIGLPGLQAGWFRLRGGDKAFCLLTAPQRASVLTADDGTRLLLSLADPRPLREALERIARNL